MSTQLRQRWAAIPGVTYAPATAAPSTPPRNKRNPEKNARPRKNQRFYRPKCYREDPVTYTTHGTRRLTPIGEPTEPGWITSEQALAILGLGHSSLSRYARLHNLTTCSYTSPNHLHAVRKYYREEEIRALLHRTDRRKFNHGHRKNSNN